MIANPRRTCLCPFTMYITGATSVTGAIERGSVSLVGEGVHGTEMTAVSVFVSAFEIRRLFWNAYGNSLPWVSGWASDGKRVNSKAIEYFGA